MPVVRAPKEVRRRQGEGTMLRNRGIRTKLLAVLALPVAVLLVAAVAVSALQLRSAARAAQVERLAAGASGARTRDQVGSGYSTVVAADIDLPARIGDGLQDRGIGTRLAVYSAAQRLAELATQQRDVGLQALAGGTPSVALAGDLR